MSIEETLVYSSLSDDVKRAFSPAQLGLTCTLTKSYHTSPQPTTLLDVCLMPTMLQVRENRLVGWQNEHFDFSS